MFREIYFGLLSIESATERVVRSFYSFLWHHSLKAAAAPWWPSRSISETHLSSDREQYVVHITDRYLVVVIQQRKNIAEVFFFSFWLFVWHKIVILLLLVFNDGLGHRELEHMEANVNFLVLDEGLELDILLNIEQTGLNFGYIIIDQ